MTFEQLKEANETIRTTEINNKPYAEVNQRIKAFRMLYPTGTISTEIISNIDGVVIIKASVLDDTGKLLGTGTAYEREMSTFINKTSYIENCETSAVGRALAMCGIGIDMSVASYEEVANAIKQQEQPKKKGKNTCYPPRDELLKFAKKKYPEGSEFLPKLLEALDNAPSIDALTDEQLQAIYAKYGGN